MNTLAALASALWPWAAQRMVLISYPVLWNCQRNPGFEPLALCQYWGTAGCVHNSSAREVETGGLPEHTGQSNQLVSSWFRERPCLKKNKERWLSN